MTLSEKQEHKTKIVDVAMDLFAEQGYGPTRLIDVAERAEVELGTLSMLVKNKADLITLTFQMVDRAVLAEDAQFGAEESVRDRLFDLLMRRFDGLQSYQKGLKAVADGIKQDPLPLLCQTPHALDSMAWYLEAAGERADGLLGIVKVKGLSILWLHCMRTFFEDDSADLSKTMSVLDKALGQAERAAGWINPKAAPSTQQSNAE